MNDTYELRLTAEDAAGARAARRFAADVIDRWAVRPGVDDDACLVVTGRGAAPNLWAQAPKQRNELRVLDVNGTRLVILSGHPSGVSTQDRSDLETILDSVAIGRTSPRLRPAHNHREKHSHRRCGGRVWCSQNPPHRVIARNSREKASDVLRC